MSGRIGLGVRCLERAPAAPSGSDTREKLWALHPSPPPRDAARWAAVLSPVVEEPAPAKEADDEAEVAEPDHTSVLKYLKAHRGGAAGTAPRHHRHPPRPARPSQRRHRGHPAGASASLHHRRAGQGHSLRALRALRARQESRPCAPCQPRRPPLGRALRGRRRAEAGERSHPPALPGCRRGLSGGVQAACAAALASVLRRASPWLCRRSQRRRLGDGQGRAGRLG